MKNSLRTLPPPLAIRIGAALVLAGLLAAQQTGSPNDLVPIDVDGDGTAEISSIEELGTAGPTAAPLVVLCVEARLLRDRTGVATTSTAAFRSQLDRLAADLADDGFRSRVLALECYAGPRHQDGRTVLALRRLLIACGDDAALAGAILIGHFPDALLTRTCNWRKQGEVDIAGADGERHSFPDGTPFLRRITEVVAHRCDLVLADLDGDWESIYVAGPAPYAGLTAVFPDGVPDEGGIPAAWRTEVAQLVDTFHVADGRAEVDGTTGMLLLDDTARDFECNITDRQAGNAIAIPDIAVSRIDARGVAFSPSPGLLGPDGTPRAVPAGDGPIADPSWSPDPELELRLLGEHLDRNHAWRTTGIAGDAFRPASIAWGLGSGMAMLRNADDAWAGFAEPGYDVTSKVGLCELVAWLQLPAALRTLRAHSNDSVAMFARTDVEALHASTGTPWHWRPDHGGLEPSLADVARAGHAGFALYRTLWSNGRAGQHPYLMLHTGCEAVSPPGADSLRHDDDRYGRSGHGESLLFFTPCVGLIGRAKVFYDEPRGFSETLRDGGTLGDAWRRYFELEANVGTWGEAGGDIGRKRAYFWSLLGDWTLRLRRPEPPVPAQRLPGSSGST